MSISIRKNFCQKFVTYAEISLPKRFLAKNFLRWCIFTRNKVATIKNRITNPLCCQFKLPVLRYLICVKSFSELLSDFFCKFQLLQYAASLHFGHSCYSSELYKISNKNQVTNNNKTVSRC
jgi:hypothetical protein